MSEKHGYAPLITGPTWREIIVEVLRTAPDYIKFSSDEDKQLMLADHILVALRRSCRPDPLDLDVERPREVLRNVDAKALEDIDRATRNRGARVAR